MRDETLGGEENENWRKYLGLGPELHRDAIGTWERLQAGGVAAVEPCVALRKEPPRNAEEQVVWDRGDLDGIFELEAAEKLIPELRSLGFDVFSFQMQAPSFSLEAVSQFIPFMKRMKLHYCIYSFMERSVSAIRAQKETICSAAKLLRAHGLELLVHNHDMEWLPDEGACVMEWLMWEIPDLRYEIDLGWTEYAGVSSVDVLEKYPDRFPLLHIKEIAKGAKAWTGSPFCTVPGTGILPLKRIMDCAKRMPLSEDTLMIDQDDSISGNIIADIILGICTLKQML